MGMGKGGRLLVWFCMILREIGGELEYKLGMILLLISVMKEIERVVNWNRRIDGGLDEHLNKSRFREECQEKENRYRE